MLKSIPAPLSPLLEQKPPQKPLFLGYNSRCETLIPSLTDRDKTVPLFAEDKKEEFTPNHEHLPLPR